MFIQWYSWLSQFSAFISQPFANAAYQMSTPLLAALFLGLAASLAPCQLSTNSGAIAYIMNRTGKNRSTMYEITAFVLGKAAVYIAFGLLAFWLGNHIGASMTPFFVFMRKVFGPLFLLVGLFMLGWVRLPGNIGMQLSSKLKGKGTQLGGVRGTFLLGLAFSLGWCPTMLWLFFGMLVPLMISNPTGFLLAPVFAVGTALPIIFVVVAAFALGFDKKLVQKSRKIGQVITKASGVVFVLIGINDIFAYWFL